jgi:hypothetical protein
MGGSRRPADKGWQQAEGAARRNLKMKKVFALRAKAD